MEDKIFKIVVYVPEANAGQIRKALGENGAGKIGNYDFTSFSTKGVGRFRPLKGADPAIGINGKTEEVLEEKIETVCYEKDIERVVQAVRKIHPYEVPVIDIYPLVNL